MHAEINRIAVLNERFVACPACDALWARPELPVGARVCCPRCDSVILAHKAQSAEKTIALLAASLVLFALVAFYPFMRMEAAGLANQISVLQAVSILWKSGYPSLAVACALLTLILPLLRIVLTMVVAFQLLLARPITRGVRILAGCNQTIAPWAMVEIFMLGVVVSLVKIGALADIQLGAAFWALAALTVTMTLGFSAVCTDTFWSKARASL